MTPILPHKPSIAIIGGGPAGLMAAETLASAGMSVTVYDHKPSLGRKLLMAGRGGLNLTHSEPFEKFIKRYGAASNVLRPALTQFTPNHLQEWCEGLGQPTFIGTSGRIFPKTLKASPLLRAWIKRLDALGVTFALNHEWQGWDEAGHLVFNQQTKNKPDATLLALGGGSWAKLGSDAAWVKILTDQNIPLCPLRPANCGFTSAWSDIFKTRFAGQPLKTVSLIFKGQTIPGEIMITDRGIEGGAVYALSSLIRDALDNNSEGTVVAIDLKPGLSPVSLKQKLEGPRGSQSFSTYLQKRLGLSPVAINLLRECVGDLSQASPSALTAAIKAVPIKLIAPFPIDCAISTAGGIKLDALDKNFMLKAKPGVFAAGEMLDWEAPTGGYLLQATFSTSIAAAKGIINWLHALPFVESGD